MIFAQAGAVACMRYCLHAETHILFCQAEELLGLSLLHLPVAACCHAKLRPDSGKVRSKQGMSKACHAIIRDCKQSDFIVHACIAVIEHGSACYVYVEAMRLLPYITTAAAMPLPAMTRLTLPQGILLMSDGGGNCVRFSTSISTSQASLMPGRCPAPTTATILVALHADADRLSFAGT